MVYYNNVIVNILWILIVFVLKIISFLKIRVMALLFLMVMNNSVIMLPVSRFLDALEVSPFRDFFLVFCEVPFTFPVGSWLVDGWGVDVSWVLDSDAVRFEHGIL